MASPVRRSTTVSIVIGIAIPIVVFGVVFPHVTSYQDAYDAVASCTPGWLMALLLASLLNVMLYPFPVLMSLRDLTYQRGFVVRQSGYLMSNLTPVGGALAVGTQFGVLTRFGVKQSRAAAAVAADALWAFLLTIALPTVAIALLAVQREGDQYLWLALIGLLMLVMSVAGTIIVLRSERGATALGGAVERALSPVMTRLHQPRLHVTASILAFRVDAYDIVRQRWLSLTVTQSLAETMPFVILFCALGGLSPVSNTVTATEVFAAYSLSIALNALPLTPGGLGMTDAALVALLVSFGADTSTAVAADIVWRLTWFLPQMLIGAGALTVHLLRVHRDSSSTAETPQVPPP